jgi:hypothetical protein
MSECSSVTGLCQLIPGKSLRGREEEGLALGLHRHSGLAARQRIRSQSNLAEGYIRAGRARHVLRPVEGHHR